MQQNNSLATTRCPVCRKPATTKTVEQLSINYAMQAMIEPRLAGQRREIAGQEAEAARQQTEAGRRQVAEEQRRQASEGGRQEVMQRAEQRRRVAKAKNAEAKKKRQLRNAKNNRSTALVIFAAAVMLCAVAVALLSPWLCDTSLCNTMLVDSLFSFHVGEMKSPTRPRWTVSSPSAQQLADEAMDNTGVYLYCVFDGWGEGSPACGEGASSVQDSARQCKTAHEWSGEFTPEQLLFAAQDCCTMFMEDTRCRVRQRVDDLMDPQDSEVLHHEVKRLGALYDDRFGAKSLLMIPRDRVRKAMKVIETLRDQLLARGGPPVLDRQMISTMMFKTF